jgi:hypothetical protein
MFLRVPSKRVHLQVLFTQLPQSATLYFQSLLLPVSQCPQ